MSASIPSCRIKQTAANNKRLAAAKAAWNGKIYRSLVHLMNLDGNAACFNYLKQFYKPDHYCDLAREWGIDYRAYLHKIVGNVYDRDVAIERLKQAGFTEAQFHAANKAGDSTPPSKWQVTAEHSCGQSTGHPCRIGAVDDPADLLDETITATDYESAIKAGVDALEKIMDDFQPCTCGRQDMAGADCWWNSVTVNAEELGGAA